MPYKLKPSGTSRTATTTYADDPDLVVALAASTTYFFEVMAVYEAGATPDFKARIAYSGTVTSALFSLQLSDAIDDRTVGAPLRSPIFGDATTINTPVGFGGAGNNTAETAGVFHWRGVVITNTSGNLSLQWAQLTSDATAATVLDGSYIRITKQSEMRGHLILKPANTGRTTVTPTDDPDLQFPSVAGAQYLCELGMGHSGGGGLRKRIADLSCADAVGHVTMLIAVAAGTETSGANRISSFQGPLISTPVEYTFNSSALATWLHCAWSQIQGGTDDTTAFEWAQNNVSGTTSVLAPSWLWYEEI